MTPTQQITNPFVLGLLVLSLVISLSYSLPNLQEAFSHPFMIQDDARQHVFWMQRFINPDLFPEDLIADYFQTIAPAGFAGLYQFAAWFGIDPILFHKLLPVVLSLITTCYCFLVCLQLFPIPAAALAASVMLMQGLGLTDAIVSATPKAFVYPLMLAFMDAVLRRNLFGVMGAIALQGLFYPQLVFLSSGVLIFSLIQQGWKGFRRTQPQTSDRVFVIAGLIVAFLVLLPYALQSHEFGPTITASEARQLPEFSIPGSRARFFYDDDPATFWLKGRSGLRFATALTPVTNIFGIVLPILLGFPHIFPLIKQIRPGAVILIQVLMSSFLWFGVAHLVLFRLHLPSRYTQHTFRIVLTLSAAIAIIVMIDALIRWASRPRQSSLVQKSIAIALTGFLSITVLGYPLFVDQFPISTYQTGRATELYAFLRTLPTDSVIASLSPEANNVPSFAQRSVLAAEEYAIPYHNGYYSMYRQRIGDTTQAQYSPDIETVKSVIRQYDVSHWLLDRRAFDPDYVANRLWVRHYPDIFENFLGPYLETQQPPALESLIRPCKVFRQQQLILLDAECILRKG